MKRPVSGAKTHFQYVTVAVATFFISLVRIFITLLHVRIVAVQNCAGSFAKRLMLYSVGK